MSGIQISGFITRANLPTPLSPLAIQVDPYWLLLGDDAEAADSASGGGVDLKQSVLKRIWADSPFVAGQQQVLATPDNSTLDLRLICDGASMVDAQSKAATIITAIREQANFQVSLSYDTGATPATYAWNVYTGDYVAAFNQVHFFGYLLPLYISCPRDPTPVSGPF